MVRPLTPRQSAALDRAATRYAKSHPESRATPADTLAIVAIGLLGLSAMLVYIQAAPTIDAWISANLF